MNEEHIFCDGSSGVIKKGEIHIYQTGVGVYFENSGIEISENCSRALGERQTNIRAELFAVIVSLQELLFHPQEYGFELGKTQATIHTDSLYSIMTITDWAPKWEKNDWKITSTQKKAKNIDLIKDILELVRRPEFEKVPIVFEHIKGHAKEPLKNGSRSWKNWYGNKTADSLANVGRRQFYN